MKFEEEEDEESYDIIRNRERREVVLFDFGEEYSSATDYGDFIHQQRLVMINWMVEVRGILTHVYLFPRVVS